MVDFATVQFKMFTPDAKGHTLYENLKIVEKTGFTPPELIEYEKKLCPVECAEVWQDFTELSASRQQTWEGPCPITFSDIVAWCRVTGKQPSTFRSDVIFAIDKAWLDNYYKNQEKLRKQTTNNKKK